MDFRDKWLGMPTPDRHQLAARLGTSYKYLQKLAGGFGLPSLQFIAKLQEELPDLDPAGFLRAKADAGRRANGRPS